MPRPITGAVVAASLLLVAACGGNSPTADVAEREEQTPSASGSSPTATASRAPSVRPAEQTSAPRPSPVVRDEDRSLIRDFVAFAVRPSADTAGRLPFAGEVQLGLGRDLKATLGTAETADMSAWVLQAEYFRAYNGPFNALEPIQRHAAETRTDSVGTRDDAFDVSVGDHPHCASPPVPAPHGFERHRRVSVQPSESSIDSCLSWFTVDLFVTGKGRIEAVTLDIWEP